MRRTVLAWTVCLSCLSHTRAVDRRFEYATLNYEDAYPPDSVRRAEWQAVEWVRARSPPPAL